MELGPSDVPAVAHHDGRRPPPIKSVLRVAVELPGQGCVEDHSPAMVTERQRPRTGLVRRQPDRHEEPEDLRALLVLRRERDVHHLHLGTCPLLEQTPHTHRL